MAEIGDDLERVRSTLTQHVPHLEGVTASMNRIYAFVHSARILTEWEKDVLDKAREVRAAKGRVDLAMQDLANVCAKR